MRRVSFQLTQPQVRARSKTQTRRLGWLWAKPGMRLRGMSQCQGLKRGQHADELAVIEIVEVRRERIDAITQADVAAEGFPEMTPADFVAMFCTHHRKVTPATEVTVVTFRYVDEPRPTVVVLDEVRELEPGRLVFDGPTLVLQGEALATLRMLASDSVDSVVTSPPYWRMRDYGHPDQLGLEADVQAFVERLADIFDEVRRVLKPTGTAWVNLGDSYARRGGGRNTETGTGRRYIGTPGRGGEGLKHGDLAMVPARFALECQRRGWYLRSEVIWHKPNPTPDSSPTRPACAHEHVWMLSKSPSPDYYYGQDDLRTPLRPTTLRAWGLASTNGVVRLRPGEIHETVKAKARMRLRSRAIKVDGDGRPLGANRSNVWSIAVAQNREAVEHFAMQPEEVARLCVIASTPPGGVVLDPFLGAGTTAIMAKRLGRRCIGIELVPETAALARRRITEDAPMLAAIEEAQPPAQLELGT